MRITITLLRCIWCIHVYILEVPGPVCSKNNNLNTTATCPGTKYLQSLDAAVVISDVEGRDGDRTVGGAVRR